MHELQTRVANRIFPKVAEELSKQSDAFANFVDKFRAHLSKFSGEAETAIADLEIGDELQLDIESSLNTFLQELMNSLQEMVDGEETRIVALLEQFVDESVEERISAARNRVAGIWGTGTTISQTVEVRTFYREVRSILKEAIRDHVNHRFAGFSAHLANQAKAIPEKALSQVQAEIDRASANIRAAAEAALTGQKDAFEKSASDLTKEISETQQALVVLLQEADKVEEPSPQSSKEQPPPLSPEPKFSNPAEIQRRATRCIERYDLIEGSQGWPFSRIFATKYLRGATEAWLVDPYLVVRHQRRNLTEFVVLLLGSTKLKTLHIITREITEPESDTDKAFYDNLDKDSFNRGGMRITYAIDKAIHDRFVVFNNGCVFKLGRGLDIFKPVTGLAVREQNLRQVKSCQIDVFAPANARSEN
jgi:hypothetical protein